MADNGPIVRSTLTEQTTSRLLEEMNDGTFPPSRPLPSEHELMKRYGVSRNVVRAALTALRSQGLILTVNGIGSFPCEQRTVQAVPRTGADPWDSLIPTKDPVQRRDYADASDAARYGVPEGEMLMITERSATRANSGQKVMTSRVTLESAFAGIAPSPKPFEMTRAELIDTFTRRHGELIEEDGFRAISAGPDHAHELGVPNGAPLMEIIRSTRSAEGQLLMTETEISTGPGTRHTVVQTPTQ